MKIIALHDHHNAAVAYMEDGEVKYAIQEERLVRIKNAGGTPINALKDTLEKNSLKISDIDAFVFVGRGEALKHVDTRDYYKGKYRAFFEKGGSGLRSLLKKLPGYSVLRKMKRDASRGEKTKKRIAPLLEMGVPEEKVQYVEHHTCHASAAAYGWGKYDEFAVLTLDSAGDGISGSVGMYKKGEIERLAKIKMGDSVGRLYSLITFYLGMMPMEHEYKVMGLSSYVQGAPKVREMADYFHSLFDNAGPGLSHSRKAGVPPVYELGPKLKKDLQFVRFDYISGGLQLFLEEFVSEWVARVLKELGTDKVALSGGLFMNVKLNKIIGELPEVKDMFVFPSCGDESNVYGAAYRHYYETTGKLPKPLGHFYGGADVSGDDEVVRAIEALEAEVSYERFDDINTEVAKLIGAGNVVARCSGRMEFGARALGNRSILADPAHPELVREINQAIKNRDFWMPFSASMTNSDKYLQNPKGFAAPYMILLFDTKDEEHQNIIAGTHQYDETCRPQVVYKEHNAEYFDLIEKVGKETGTTAVLNTSFNLHGYPIVYTAEDALFVLQNSGLKYLVLGNYLVTKK